MADMAERCRNTKGGALLSKLYAFCANGDPLVKSLAMDTIRKVSRSFYRMLERWVLEGELEDPFCEFFVTENADILDQDERFWAGEYMLLCVCICVNVC